MKNKRLLFIIVLFGGGLLALYYFYNPASSNSFFPSCPTKKILGIYCPGCGSQRATHFLLHCEWLTAFRYNPLFVLLLPIIFLLLFQSAVNTFTHKRLYVGFLEKRWFIMGLFYIVCIYFIVRNLPYDVFEFLRPPSYIKVEP